MKGFRKAVFVYLSVHVSLACAQFVPHGATAPSRPTQPGKSGINTRPAIAPAPSIGGQASMAPPSTIPQSLMSKEACQKWLKQKKTEHEACVKS